MVSKDFESFTEDLNDVRVSAKEENMNKLQKLEFDNRKANLQNHCQNYIKHYKLENFQTLPIVTKLKKLTKMTKKQTRPVRNPRNGPNAIMCAPPKTGTTSWQSSMIALSENITILELMSREDYDEDNIHGILDRHKWAIPKAELLYRYLSDDEEDKKKYKRENKLIDNNDLQKYMNSITPFLNNGGIIGHELNNLKIAKVFKEMRKIKKEGSENFDFKSSPIQNLTTLSENLFTQGKAVKFMNTRHPISRLLSCWNDKFNYAGFGNETAESEYLSYINSKHNKFSAHNSEVKSLKKVWLSSGVQKYETLASKNKKSPKSTFSLNAFLKFIANGSNGHVNMHWVPMHEVCSPCIIDYDYITRLESIEEDSRTVLKALKAEWVGEFPRTRNYHDKNLSNNKRQPNYIEKLQKSMAEIDKETIIKLYEVYKWDFLLFGYEIEPFLNNPYNDAKST